MILTRSTSITLALLVLAAFRSEANAASIISGGGNPGGGAPVGYVFSLSESDSTANGSTTYTYNGSISASSTGQAEVDSIAFNFQQSVPFTSIFSSSGAFTSTQNGNVYTFTAPLGSGISNKAGVNFTFVSPDGPTGAMNATDIISSLAGATLYDETSPDFIAPGTSATPAGTTADAPVLPNDVEAAQGGGVVQYGFTNATTNLWYDPPTTYGYTYTMTGGTLFTGIDGFPPGYSGLTVTDSNGDTYSNLSSSSTVDFTDGGALSGATSFTLTGISPPVDGSNSQAFPLLLEFSSPTGNDFNVMPLSAPEPTSLTLCGIGAVSVLGFAWRRHKKGDASSRLLNA